MKPIIRNALHSIQSFFGSTLNQVFHQDNLHKFATHYNPVRALKEIVPGALEVPSLGVAGVEGSGIMILLASRPKNPGDRSAKGINGGRGKNVKVDPPRPAKEKKLTYGDVEKGVRSAVIKMKRNQEIKKIKNNHQLSDLGFDSLSIIELLVMLEEKFDIEIPDQVEDRILAGTVQDAINDMVALLDVKK